MDKSCKTVLEHMHSKCLKRCKRKFRKTKLINLLSKEEYESANTVVKVNVVK